MTTPPAHKPVQPWQPDPLRQKLATYTLEDVLGLPPDAPRVELVDGVMLAVPSPSIGHQRIGTRLASWFDKNSPKGYFSVTAIGVAVTANETYEPDIVVARQELETDFDTSRHYLTPDQVVIAVEVVSPGTRKRDRLIKPAGYAAAGIRYYWRIEQDPLHVFAYRLGRQGTYELVADSEELLELAQPFEIRLPISEIAP